MARLENGGTGASARLERRAGPLDLVPVGGDVDVGREDAT